jgi:hypothetical protein
VAAPLPHGISADLGARALPDRGLARERVLPVVQHLAPLLPSGGLVRGETVATRGAAAMSLAIALAVEATAAGSWMAVVDVPTIGLEATSELGIPLERVVRVDTSPTSDGRGWAELLAAVVDGFELVLTRVPPSVSPGLVRRVQARLRTRDAVLVVLGAASAMSPAVELHTTHAQWVGVERGAGHLQGRRVTVTATGRRVPRPRRAELWLPDHSGKVTPAAEVTASPPVDLGLDSHLGPHSPGSGTLDAQIPA